MVIRPEEFRPNATLQNLADILGIDRPASQPIIEYNSLQVSLFRPCFGPSKGIALAMPGLGGFSKVQPYLQAGFFQDYDCWMVDFPIKKGSMLHDQRWWMAALEIVQGIKDGVIPAPRIVFGFSFGGGLAWLVARLLAGSPLCPEFVIMVDAPPLHRRPKLRHRALKKALKRATTVHLPQVLHIRRSQIGNGFVPSDNKQEWNHNDSIQQVIDLPTFNHVDMVNPEMLALAREAVIAFLNNKETDFQWRSVVSPPSLLSCQIFYAMHGCQTALQHVMDELSKGNEVFSLSSLLNLAILMYTRHDKNKSEELMRLALSKSPDSGSVQFILRRIRRKSSMLFSEDVPRVFPLSIVSAELKLASSHHAMHHAMHPAMHHAIVRPAPRPIRFLCLAFDVASAMFAARYVKYI